ncbi:unnamed protein product, partial [Symbiodinium sp. CCMP2456]
AKTQVLRFICDKQYTDGWSKSNASPGTQARRWLAELSPQIANKVQDSWGWELQNGQVAVMIMQNSGRIAAKQRWFVEKTPSADLQTPFNGPIAVQWQDVEKLLQDLKFTEIEIIEKFRHKARAGWSFRAIKADDGDLLEVEDHTGELITIELQRRRGIGSRQHVTPLPAEVRTSFATEPTLRKGDKAKHPHQPAAPDGEMAPESMDVDAAKQAGDKREAQAASAEASKRAKVGPPDGFQPLRNA